MSNMWGEEMMEYRKEIDVRATGSDVPRPIVSFTHAGFDDTLLKEIVKRGFEAPTPIQVRRPTNRTDIQTHSRSGIFCDHKDRHTDPLNHSCDLIYKAQGPLRSPCPQLPYPYLPLDQPD